jgi:hypothetical protein
MREKLAEGRRDMRSDDEGACPTKKAALQGNSYASKNERRIELSLMHVGPDNEMKQIRSKTGGGTRHLTVAKTTTMIELKEMGRNLYFPDGQCARGYAKDFWIDVKDFQMNSIDHSKTVGDFYETTKMRLLKFFIVTRPNNEMNSKSVVPVVSDSDILPDISVSMIIDIFCNS